MARAVRRSASRWEVEADGPWWRVFGRDVLAVHEHEDEPLLFTVRRAWSLLPRREVRDADGQRVGSLLGRLVQDRYGQTLAAVQCGEDGGVFRSPQQRTHGRVDRDGRRAAHRLQRRHQRRAVRQDAAAGGLSRESWIVNRESKRHDSRFTILRRGVRRAVPRALRCPARRSGRRSGPRTGRRAARARGTGPWRPASGRASASDATVRDCRP